MFDFIVYPLVTGIVTLGIYKLFELFARRKERLFIIEKVADKILPVELCKKLQMPSFSHVKFDFSSYGALKIGLLLLGIGLGMLFAFFVSAALEVSDTINILTNDGYRMREVLSVVYGGSVLLCGGAGLVGAFILEQKYRREDESRERAQGKESEERLNSNE